ncbi:FHA domain-containing protein [Marinobacterium jannaschii]|uniref:FHA domain-containing protein n=1 Tax=Marinobacterium jannaschii TaxID=64970 RepID=UPI000489067D|nr:FHA domain-containing protein [Marinobacterium jannaschii]
MSISLQLVEVPPDEQVINRQVALPESGGTIGRAYDCTLQLADFNRQLSRVHAEIAPAQGGGYQVTDRSTNGVHHNGKLLGRGQHQRLHDGDTLKLGSYLLLVSDMNSLFSETDDPFAEDQPAMASEPQFDTENLQAQESGWPLEEVAAAAADLTPEPQFSRENVLADDRFGYDPFEDELEMRDEGPVMRNDMVTLDQPVSGDAQLQLNEGLKQLNLLIEQQRRLQAEPYGHEQLMDCLQRTLDRFLDELDPGQLEESFDDYISGWGSRDKKYWKLYRKQFSRKLERREFHRQFSALFVEELRGKK